MSTYQPQPGVFAGRPPCVNCGAAYRLHHDSNLLDGARYCPEAYRPDTLERAQRELADAVTSGDPAREFVARGNLQRLGGLPKSNGCICQACAELGRECQRTAPAGEDECRACRDGLHSKGVG